MSHAHGTSRYGRLFWTGVVLGWAGIGFGVVSAFTHWRSVDPPQFVIWIVGLALLHDLVMAPAVSLIGKALAGAGGRWWLGVVEAALLASGSIVLFSIPLVAGWGRQADNPSLLPRGYLRGPVLILGLIWVLALAALVRRRHLRSVARTELGGDTP